MSLPLPVLSGAVTVTEMVLFGDINWEELPLQVRRVVLGGWKG